MEIKIQKFKQLDNIQMELGDITLLVGGNNAGKSSILQAIQFGVSIAQATTLPKNAKYSWAKGRLGTSIGQNELVYLPIKEINFLALNGKLADAISISYVYNNKQAGVNIKKGKNKNISIEIIGQELGEKIQSIQQPFSMLVTGLAGIANEEKYQTPWIVKKSAARGDSNSVFRNILLLLKKDNNSWIRFKAEIQQIFPNYEIEVDFDKNKDEFINCVVKKSNGIVKVKKSNEINYPIDTCGTGVLQVIQIISYIYLFKPKILLLDEPDSHLHPNNQRLLAKRLISLSQEMDTKIVISTHSIYLVEGLIDESKLYWLSDGKIKTNIDKYLVESLMDIGALGIEKKLISPKWILLTEDSDTSMLECLVKANGANLNEVEIKSYKGCTKIETAQVLLSYLQKEYPQTKFIIHRDRDFLDDDNIQKWKDKFSDFQDISFLIPEFNDIESYFFNPEHIAHAFKMDETDIENMKNEIFEDKKGNLIRKYIDVKKQNYGTWKEQSENAGKMGEEAFELFKSYGPNIIHGKTFLKAIKDRLSREKGISDFKPLLSISPALKHDNIQDLFVANFSPKTPKS